MRIVMMTITFIGAVVACLTVNVFAQNGQTAFHIVSRFPVPIAPSPIVLCFWFVVYGALAYSLYMLYKAHATVPALPAILFNLAMLTHALTFFSWQQQLFGMSVFFAFLAPLLLLHVYRTCYREQKNRSSQRIALSLTISFFSCLLLWEAAFFITYVEWGGFGLSEQLWGVLLLTVALIIGMAIRYVYNDPYFLIAYAWLYMCILIEHHIDNLFISSVALFLLGATLVSIKYMKKTNK